MNHFYDPYPLSKVTHNRLSPNPLFTAMAGKTSLTLIVNDNRQEHNVVAIVNSVYIINDIAINQSVRTTD